MSKARIRAALETALDAINPKLATAWENMNFVKPVEAYQEVWLMLAKPENPTFGDNFYRQRGYLQIDLNYPQNTGPGNADARAELYRNAFARGLSFASGGLTTTVEETPEIAAGAYEESRYVVRVFVRFFANVQP